MYVSFEKESIMPKQIKMWRTIDGLYYVAKIDAIQHEFEYKTGGEAHVCPVCGGCGTIPDKDSPILGSYRDREAEGYNGWHSQPVYNEGIAGYNDKMCKVCDGNGFTSTIMKPITEEVVIGYE